MTAGTTPLSTASVWLGLAVETTRGTGVSPTSFIPVRSPVFDPNLAMLEDKGLRGSMVDVYGMIPGIQSGAINFSGDVFMDTFPNLLRCMLGSTDTVTGAGPYTHVMSLLNNTASTANQPPSYSVRTNDGYTSNFITGALLDTLDVKFNAANLLEYSAKYVGLYGGPMGFDATSPSFSTLNPAPTWKTTVKLAGTAFARVSDGEINFKRNVKPIDTIQNSQQPLVIFADRLSLSGKLTVVVYDETELSNYLNDVQPSLEFTFSDTAATANTLDLAMAQVAWKTAKPSLSKEFKEIALEFVAIPNTTNATAGGVSPVKATAVNAQSAAY